MASAAEYEAAGVPARQLGRGFGVWKKADLVTILHHFGINPNLRHRSTGSKLQLLRLLDRVTQRHGLTVRDRKLILRAKNRHHSLTPNGERRLEGSHRIAWERRLSEIARSRRRFIKSNASASHIPPDSDDDGSVPIFGSRSRATTPPNIPSDSDDDERPPAVVSPNPVTNLSLNRPPVGRVGHSHSSSGSVSRAHRFSPSGGRGGSLVRPTTIQPTASSLADNSSAVGGPAISTSSGPTHEGSSARGPKERECSICLDSLCLERFPKRNITSTCNHAPDVCLSCLAQSIATQFSTKVWDQIDCPTCSQRLQHTDIKTFASSVVFEKYV